MNRSRIPLPALLAAIAASGLMGGCSATTHPTQPATLGQARRSADLLAVIDQPGPIQVETVNSTNWAVPLSGLVNLDAPAAKAEHLADRDEPIQVYFHVLRHPGKGTFLVDTGVQKALRDDPGKAAMGGLVARVMHREKMDFRAPLGDWLAAHPEPIAGVLFTHLHLDHVAGAPDLPKTTPLYAGPGETTAKSWMFAFTQGSIDRTLEGLPAIQEWPFAADADGRFAGVVDVFGDGTLWALHCPGHTPGSTAYLARTPRGPVLLVGDTAHTAWGWSHDVEPGSFTANHEENRTSLAALRRLAAEHPAIDVRLGHQSLH